MTTVTAIVLSYNRPRMLGEALATVAANRPDQVVVVDDGSRFDVVPLVEESCPGARYVLADAMTVAQRLVTPRLGSLINRALGLATGDIIAYLCDDDLWADVWLDAVRAHWDAHPGATLVRGDWLVFRDGEPATTACPPCRLDERQMTTGNFAHRRGLAGAVWPTDSISSHDDLFCWNLYRAGHDIFRVPRVGFAGWRREHKYNALHFTNDHHYAPNAATMLAGWLEEER
jgi:glycosyltransferase involved in cell wall biosynthesis